MPCLILWNNIETFCQHREKPVVRARNRPWFLRCGVHHIRKWCSNLCLTIQILVHKLPQGHGGKSFLASWRRFRMYLLLLSNTLLRWGDITDASLPIISLFQFNLFTCMKKLLPWIHMQIKNWSINLSPIEVSYISIRKLDTTLWEWVNIQGKGLWCLTPLSIFLLYRGSQSVWLVEETIVHRENNRLTACHWQTLSDNAVSSTPRHERYSKSLG